MKKKGNRNAQNSTPKKNKNKHLHTHLVKLATKVAAHDGDEAPYESKHGRRVGVAARDGDDPDVAVARVQKVGAPQLTHGRGGRGGGGGRAGRGGGAARAEDGGAKRGGQGRADKGKVG